MVIKNNNSSWDEIRSTKVGANSGPDNHTYIRLRAHNYVNKVSSYILVLVRTYISSCEFIYVAIRGKKEKSRIRNRNYYSVYVHKRTRESVTAWKFKRHYFELDRIFLNTSKLRLTDCNGEKTYIYS